MATAKHSIRDRARDTARGNRPKSPDAPHPLRGLLLFVGALLLFAGMDTTTKFLSATHSVPVIMSMRYIVHFLLMVALVAPREGKALMQTTRTGLVLVRGASLAVGSLFVGLALHRMPVAETTAIIFLSPMVVVLLARPLLGERIGALGWIAAAAGFIGVLMVAHPGGVLDTGGVIYALCSVGALASYQLLSRTLVTTERTITMLFYTAMVGSIAFGMMLPWFWVDTAPTPLEWLLFLGMGVAGGLGHFLYTAAYRHTQASLLAPLNYLQLLWAVLLGWLVFDHVPDHLSIIGMCVIAASGLMIALKSRRRTAA
jgi:drug/metabolite transporter (DMT)-like permease